MGLQIADQGRGLRHADSPGCLSLCSRGLSQGLLQLIEAWLPFPEVFHYTSPTPILILLLPGSLEAIKLEGDANMSFSLLGWCLSQLG